MKSLKVYYTISYFLTEHEMNLYAIYFDYARIAKARNIPFEMISFQEEPGRFLTDPVIFGMLDGSDDTIFPITVLNDKVVKTSALPADTEFAHWFESLQKISYKTLVEEYTKMEDYTSLAKSEPEQFCSADQCACCSAAGCCGMRDDPFGDLIDDVDSFADV